MVVVKQLDPKYPRMGYEIQKGLMMTNKLTLAMVIRKFPFFF